MKSFSYKRSSLCRKLQTDGYISTQTSVFTIIDKYGVIVHLLKTERVVLRRL